MSRLRSRYTAAFKENAVRLAQENGKPMKDIAASLGISNSLLSKWMKKCREEALPARKADAKPDLRQLAERIERLEGSLDVLRKLVQGELLHKLKSEFPG